MIGNLTTHGFLCPRCSDGISYPEKIMCSLLKNLDIEFKTQLTKSTLKWCKKYKYDFYIPSLKCIIEVHGLQHYEDTSGVYVKTLEEEQENDRVKKELALVNNIKEEDYIVIDCRKSELEWIKNKIIHSRLAELFDLSKVDWLKCHEFAISSLVKKVCDLWNSGLRNIKLIKKELKITESPIRKYLNQGTKLGWCDYNGKEQKEIHYKNMLVSVICVNTGEIFSSIREAELKYKTTGVSACCRNIRKSTGKHPTTSEKLVWMYYEDYLKLPQVKLPINKPIKEVALNCDFFLF